MKIVKLMNKEAEKQQSDIKVFHETWALYDTKNGCWSKIDFKWLFSFQFDFFCYKRIKDLEKYEKYMVMGKLETQSWKTDIEQCCFCSIISRSVPAISIGFSVSLCYITWSSYKVSQIFLCGLNTVQLFSGKFKLFNICIHFTDSSES